MALRVYLPPETVQPPQAVLPPGVQHYLRVVLRLGPGAEFIAFDGSGRQWRLRLGEGATAELLEDLPAHPEPPTAVTLYQGLPKGKRWPLIIQKCTELGVARLVPVQSRHCVIRLGDCEAEAKRDRWQKIATEAAEQSGGLRPPEVAGVMAWPTALAEWQASGQPGLLLDETLAASPDRGLRQALGDAAHQRVAVFVGPEGGWSENERLSGREAGLRPVSLGGRILRAETAAIVVCALIRYELGALG